MKRLTKRILAILISAAILAGAGYAFYLSKNQKAAQSKESAPDWAKCWERNILFLIMELVERL